MSIGDLYLAFAVASIVSTGLFAYLMRPNPALSYLGSLAAMLPLAHVILAWQFDPKDLGPFYLGLFVLHGVVATLGLLVLHIGIRIVMDLAGGGLDHS
jgi:hypothetical protein